MITIMIIIVYLNMVSLLQLSLSLLHNISGNQTWQWNPPSFSRDISHETTAF